MFSLFNTLVSPEKKSNLYFNKFSNNFTSEEGNFEIHNGIPILLPKNHNIHTIEHYTKDAEFFDYFEERFPETAKEEERLYQYIFSKIPPQAKLIADVGCGRGWLAKTLLDFDRIVVSIDVSYKNVSTVLQKYPSEHHYGVVADGYYLPFKDETFDCIVASEVIEHLEKPSLFVAELFRVLKNRGKLILSTPYKEKIKYSLCIHCNKPTPHNAHIHSFDESKLNGMLKKTLPKEKSEWKFYRFGNRLIQYLRLYRLLSFLPFPLWKFFDNILNLIFNRPVHILIVIAKKWE